MRRFKLILVAFLFAFCEISFSQVYPVQLSAQLIPPYSGYLPDYADPSSEKLKIILQFNDFLTPQYNVRLKLEIKGNGFTLVTKQLFNPPPINLQSGVPLLLSGADLAPYLNSNNLDFIGINQSQYEQRMALPEGYYSICVKAYDYYNPGNIQVSNESCSQAWFTLSDPPFLNLPQCGKNVTPQNPQNILFQWTPMNMSSPNSAANTEYEFALWEVRPDSSANPNQVILSTAPIFSTTTNLTLLNYGIAEPPLNIYMKYVWRVRAKDITGRDWFKNSGYSQICTFVYGNVQTVLGNALNLTLSAEGITHRLGKCTWNTQNIYTKYLLQVRKTGTENWFDYNCTTGFEKINNLVPNTTYEARVRGEGTMTGDWSNIATFNTSSEPNYSCNDQTQYADALAAQPLPAHKAIIGLIIQTGQFEVITTQINPSGPTGWYSGKGYAKVFGALPLAVQFNNIFIDDNNRHQQGVIQALTQGIDNWVHEWDVKDAEEHANAMPGVVDSIYIKGNQICVKIQGKISDSCFTFPPNQNVVVVRDDNGNQWTVTVNPPPPTITGPTNYNQYSNDELDASDSTIVVFEESSAQVYGFDEKKYTAWINNYELIKLRNGKNYFVPYKSVKEFGNDEVYAKIDIKDFVESKLSFKTENSFELTKTVVDATTYKLSVPYQYKSVNAWYDGKKVGKLNVVSLKTIAKKLVIVPVGNANISTSNLQADLNKIFGQANVNWSVTVKPSYTFNLGNDGLKAADATLMSKYSEEMRALRDAYKQATPDYDKEAYYIFVVSNFDEASLKGYMVRGRALGFVTANATTKDIAHELAHGAFGLEHTFPAIGKNTSKNLLDYGDGTELGKVQWEEMQTRPASFIWLGHDEEDASMSNNRIQLLELLGKIKNGSKSGANVNIGTYPVYMSIGKTFLGGIDYDYIYCKIITNKQSISPKNKIKEYISLPNGNMSAVPYIATCKNTVLIDSTVQIIVPDNRIANMKYYLQDVLPKKNILLFVNGYRAIFNFDGSVKVDILEYENTNNAVTQNDGLNYWAGIDADFINRIGTKNTFYADGHHKVYTSNHKTLPTIGGSFLGSINAKKAADMQNYPLPSFTLDTIPWITGFTMRFNNGVIAGNSMLQKFNSGEFFCNKDQNGKIIDTLDVVSHSMGFAYAQGMIQALKTKFILGRYYIIAPENACSGSVNLSDWGEVWQYGTNEKTEKKYLQDGVAPQCPVNGIGIKRVYIPQDGTVSRGFLESHTIANYKWIFYKQFGQDGYVKPRK